MPWPQIFSSSSSTSSNCSSSSSSRNQRQITRPKKFSNIQEIKGGGTPTTTCSYLDLARSPPPRLSSVVVAHPLPVPDLSSLFSSADRKLVSSAGCGGAEHFRLPSPDEVSVWDKDRERVKGKERVRGKERERLGDSLSRDDGAEGSSINFSNGRNQTSQTEVHDSIDAQRSVDRVQKWLTRNEPQTVKDLDRVQDNFSIQVPFRSAPASGYASPVLSPPKMSPGDLLSSYLMGPPQVWSAPEMPSKCMSSGLVHGVCQERTVLSRDSSPIRSPSVTSPLKTRKSTSESASPGHPKLCVESSMTYLENSNGHANVHPLPLPPGATSPSQISPVPRAAAKPEYSPIKGQWQKGKIIGRGTFGSVYVATNRETGALCAMKEVELLPDDPKSAECMKQLEQEIKVLSQLKHPNIVQYFGSAIVEDRFYIYLEYVYPGSINKYVREHCGAITESVVRNFTRHILSGLAYLHSKKTIHRDIKGANLLVDASGIVKLADFGMAKLLTGQATDLSLKGSPYWMAPELMQAVIQKDNNSDLAFAVDIWSLGCTIIEMLTGKPPWSEYEGAAAMFRVLKESPPIPESLSAEGKDFLCGCFRRNPAERPSASKLLEHRFVRTSHPQQPDLPSFLAFGGLTLADKGQTTQTPGEVAYRRATSPNSRTSKRP